MKNVTVKGREIPRDDLGPLVTVGEVIYLGILTTDLGLLADYPTELPKPEGEGC